MQKLIELLKRQQYEISSLQESWDTFQSQMMAFQDNLEALNSGYTAETHDADCECSLCYEKEISDFDELISKYE